MCSCLSESESTKAFKSTFVKNTHNSGTLRPTDPWLQSATPWRLYFQARYTRRTSFSQKAKRIDRLPWFSEEITSTPSRPRWLTAFPSNEQKDVGDECVAEPMAMLRFGSGWGNTFLTVTPHCRISTTISILRSPHHRHRNAPGHRRERRLVTRKRVTFTFFQNVTKMRTFQCLKSHF